MQFAHLQLLVAGLFVFVPSAAVAQDWYNTCQSTLPYVSGNYLYATCRTDSGTQSSTSLNLDACIANYNGQLACAANGYFSGSCDTASCELAAEDISVMECYCKNDSGSYVASLVDLGKWIRTGIFIQRMSAKSECVVHVEQIHVSRTRTGSWHVTEQSCHDHDGTQKSGQEDTGVYSFGLGFLYNRDFTGFDYEF
ncbi:Cyanovirin-N [Hygrophoropsis aurantiaca]|uniref:Cyanovirin-N n=1 Tax=Hygrophoropsis aurantiaca TaxID=72124 RepID=A0ACB8A3T7_9AGAM|nr:Cyanovirin-N [Hygrophoropsis aurantiaca]